LVIAGDFLDRIQVVVEGLFDIGPIETLISRDRDLGVASGSYQMPSMTLKPAFFAAGSAFFAKSQSWAAYPRTILASEAPAMALKSVS
jgi:hypothetical protein